MFCQYFSSPLQRVVPYILVHDQRSIFQDRIEISHTNSIYIFIPQTKPGCSSKDRCDYQGIYRCFERFVVWLQESRWLLNVVVVAAGQSAQHLDVNADGC